MMDLQKRVKTLKENLGKTKGEVSHDLNVLKSQNQKQTEEIGLLKSKGAELEGANTTLKTENETLKSKCNILVMRNADLESKVRALEGRTKKGGDLYELLEEIKTLVGGVGEDVDAMIIEHKRSGPFFGFG
jgi:chromosome segregation ATPase